MYIKNKKPKYSSLSKTFFGTLIAFFSLSSSAGMYDQIDLWNRQNCKLTNSTKWYPSIFEEIANRLQVNPRSVTLERLSWTELTHLYIPGTYCWATFYTPRGTQLCAVAFDKNRAIFRAGCNGLGPNICAGSCDQIKVLGLE